MKFTQGGVILRVGLQLSMTVEHRASDCQHRQEHELQERLTEPLHNLMQRRMYAWEARRGEQREHIRAPHRAHHQRDVARQPEVERCDAATQARACGLGDALGVVRLVHIAWLVGMGDVAVECGMHFTRRKWPRLGGSSGHSGPPHCLGCLGFTECCLHLLARSHSGRIIWIDRWLLRSLPSGGAA